MLHPLSIHQDAVGGIQIDDVDLQAWTSRVDPDLGVAAGDPGVVDSQVSLTATTDHQSWRLEWMPSAIDLEHKRCPVDSSLACPTGAWRDAGHSLGGDGEAAGWQLRVKLEADLHRAIEDVAHFAGVVTQLSCQFGVQGVGVRGELVMVVLGKMNAELVGDQALVAGHQLGLGVELPLQARCDLDGLHVAFERAREDAVDSALHFLLKARENAHVPPLPEVHLDAIRRTYEGPPGRDLSWNRWHGCKLTQR